jgi:hypothetical protein
MMYPERIEELIGRMKRVLGGREEEKRHKRAHREDEEGFSDGGRRQKARGYKARKGFLHGK